jgi:hypothetical protein
LDFLIEAEVSLAWWVGEGFILVIRSDSQCVVTDDVGWVVESGQQGAQTCIRTPSGAMVCETGSSLPANRTAVATEVVPSVLDEMHFIGCRKAASLAARATLEPESEPGPESKPNVEPKHESEPEMRLYKAPATVLLIQPLFLLQKSARAHPAWQYTHTRVTHG